MYFLGIVPFCRVWLRGVARVLLQSQWETRRVAMKCISEVVVLRPVVAEWLLGDLEEVAEKVRECAADCRHALMCGTTGRLSVQTSADSTD